MPVDRDLAKLRINDVYEPVSELNRLTSKRFNEMSIDEKYSMRYNVIVPSGGLSIAVSSHSFRALWLKARVLCRVF